MAMALGRKNLDEAGKEIENLFNNIIRQQRNIFSEIFILTWLIQTGRLFSVTEAEGEVYVSR